MGRGSDRRGRPPFFLLCVIEHDMLADTSLVLFGARTVSNPLEVHHNDEPATSSPSQVARRWSADEVKSRPLRAAREPPSCLTGKILNFCRLSKWRDQLAILLPSDERMSASSGNAVAVRNPAFHN